MEILGFHFMTEKREGFGEDSDPLYIIKDNFYAVGVFDGMGGSGAAICKSDYGDSHTQAYVASRIIKESVEKSIQDSSVPQEISHEKIKEITENRMRQEQTTYPAKKTALKSKLVREYPTTLAVVTALQEDDGSFLIKSYWAGDSRNYLWNEDGFFQLSQDDLNENLDPLENLQKDAALSNCICADRPYHINKKEIKSEKKIIILSASDGCFNYFETPMHFQKVLLDTLRQAHTKEEWGDLCKIEIQKLTGDDTSLSLVGVGFENFEDLKDTFEKTKIKECEKIDQIEKTIENLSKEIMQLKEQKMDAIKKGWDEYKCSYLNYFNTAIGQASEQTGNFNQATESSRCTHIECKCLDESKSSVKEGEGSQTMVSVENEDVKDLSKKKHLQRDDESVEDEQSGLWTAAKALFQNVVGKKIKAKGTKRKAKGKKNEKRRHR